MKTLKVKLSADSIQKAITELNDYKSDLKRKCDELCSELILDGYKVASVYINSSRLAHTITLQSEITEEEAGFKAILMGIGTTTQTRDYQPFNTLLAVEFGAGIRYNSGKENPKSAEFGLGVGTFPGQTHAFEDVWYYLGNDNKWHPSSGVEATMPMYNAAKEMRDTIAKKAREIFTR